MRTSQGNRNIGSGDTLDPAILGLGILMPRSLLAGVLISAMAVSMAAYAQNQSTPAGHPAFTASYPMDRAGIFIQSSGWTLVANQVPAKTRASHGIAASLSYGLVPAKVVADYRGEHAPTQVSAGQPVLCICHIMSLPGDPVLVRLHAKKDMRELNGGKMIVYPIVGGSRAADADKSDLVPVDVEHPDAQVWLVRPQAPLEPGEYALMLGTQNLSLYAFGVRGDSAHPSGTN